MIYLVISNYSGLWLKFNFLPYPFLSPHLTCQTVIVMNLPIFADLGSIFVSSLPLFDSNLLRATITLSTFHILNTTKQMN